jgi:hypothetical protein
MDIIFSPFIPVPYLIAIAIIAAIPVLIAILRGQRGAVLRALAMTALIAAIANPLLMREEREPLTTIVPVIVDKTQSQSVDGRQQATDAALNQLNGQLGKLGSVETRVVTVDNSNEPSPSTRLFSALSSAISDVAPSRIGGAIFVTDGQVHDVPTAATSVEQALGFQAPLSALITGKADEFDRRIEIVQSPRFGIVNEEQRLNFRVIDDGRPAGDVVSVTAKLNGEALGDVTATTGEITGFSFSLPRGGSNILEFSVGELSGEITTLNNRAIAAIDGVRQNLRVLLVSGEPHSGERSWRNLLKSDTSVDLVHFTILRPPEKQDGTPINELSLIPFPIRELFIDKINDFDLIVLDRFQHRGGVLPILYYDYIAQYVQNGGALLIAAGPELANESSIALTPLANVMPALPTGDVSKVGFYPRLSEQGKMHPVTRDLQGAGVEPPNWGRWFRSVGVSQPSGQTVMNGPNGEPLLVINRQGEGRIAMLLSDQGWLWARGFEGGGPYVSLYRRIAHWLMKEPKLEEEALTATARGPDLIIERQTMGEEPGTATVTTPSGAVLSLEFTKAEPGLFRIEQAMEETGLYEITNGDLTTLAHVGAVDSREYRSMVSTEERLRPLTAASLGSINRLQTNSGEVSLPTVTTVKGTIRQSDGERIRIKLTEDSVLKSVQSLPLFAGFAGLGLLLLAFSAMWWREGRYASDPISR